MAAITGKSAEFLEGHIRDTAMLDRLFQEHRICSLRLLEAMDRAGVRNLVFSSAATVYGDPASVPIREDFPLSATNLGTGRGYSVLDMVRAFAAASDREVRYQIAERRPGDVASCYADPTHAKTVLGWDAKRGIDTMCTDHWRWQSENPNGYRG